MERLARRVIDSKNIRCHVEFEYHPLQTSISTRFVDILPRMSDQREIPFHALKCLMSREIHREGNNVFLLSRWTKTLPLASLA